MTSTPAHSQTYTFSKPVLLVSRAFAPRRGGSVVVMKNLLDGFSDKNLIVATTRTLGQSTSKLRFKTYEIITGGRGSGRIKHFLWRTQVGLAARKLAAIIREHKVAVLAVTYPDIYFLDIAERAARITGIPLSVYLHDTVAEALARKSYASYASAVQKRVFQTAAQVITQNSGMYDFYLNTYGLDTPIVRHTYPETPAEGPAEQNIGKTGMWAGDAYAINRNALRRVYQSMMRNGVKLSITTPNGEQSFLDNGFQPDYFEANFLPSRAAYLTHMRRHAFLVLALEWPDESAVHEMELSTIFPTKAIEYLASGRPIVAHCPQHYYLARFLRENDCGEVITERSPAALDAAIQRLLTDPGRCNELIRNGLKTMALFDREKVAGIYHGCIETLIGTKEQP